MVSAPARPTGEQAYTDGTGTFHPLQRRIVAGTGIGLVKVIQARIDVGALAAHPAGLAPGADPDALAAAIADRGRGEGTPAPPPEEPPNRSTLSQALEVAWICAYVPLLLMSKTGSACCSH